MQASADQVLVALRAIGEATRLRIVALLGHGELSVTELTDILDQSQPRISRHLRLLIEASVIERHREGNRTFFSLNQHSPARHLIEATLIGLDPDDSVLAADFARLDRVHHNRAIAAEDYFSRIAPQWEQLRSYHASETKVEAAVVSMTADLGYSSVLDLGTGTGRMLQILSAGQDLNRIAGLDVSHAMLAIARSQLDAAGLVGVELRQGDLNNPPFEQGSFDLVVIHQVLHYLTDPDRAVQIAARMVAPGGHLLIVDFAPHELAFLQTDHAHRRLGFQSTQVASWMAGAGLDAIAIDEVAPEPPHKKDALTVLLWRGRRPSQPIRTEPEQCH